MRKEGTNSSLRCFSWVERRLAVNPAKKARHFDLTRRSQTLSSQPIFTEYIFSVKVVKIGGVAVAVAAR